MQENPRTDSEPLAWAGGERAAIFGPFSLDLKTGELHKGNARIRLQNKPFRILKALIERSGNVVTREELRTRLWPEDTFVDFESGLNTAANRLRLALSDSAENPRYIETLPRIGYRFIASVEIIERANEHTNFNSNTYPEHHTPQGAGGSQNGSHGAAAALVPAPAPPVVIPRVTEQNRRIPVIVLSSLASLAVILLAVTLTLHVFNRQTAPVFHQLTFRRGLVDNARFTPSGEVVYSASWNGEKSQLFLTDIGSPESRQLEFGSGELTAVSKSSDIAFIRYGMSGDFTPELVNVPIHGGSPRVVDRNIQSADWGPDGTLCLIRRDQKGLTVEFPAGTPIYSTQLAIETPRVSPDGSSVALIEHPLREDDGGSILLLDRSGRARHLTDNWASIKGLAWGSRGREIWFAAAKQGIDRDVYAVNLNRKLRRVAGMPAVLELYDIAPSGRALIGRSSARLSLFLGSLKSKQIRDGSWLDWSHLCAISGDGNEILFDESGEGGGPLYTVYLRRTDTGATERVAHGRAFDLSPDGAWILVGDHSPSSQIMLLSASGKQPGKKIAAPGMIYQSAHFAGDSRTLVVQLSKGAASEELFLQDIDSGVLRKVPTSAHMKSVLVSADGKRAASADSSHRTLIVDLENGHSSYIQSKTPSRPVGWTKDSQLILAVLDHDKTSLEEIPFPGLQPRSIGTLPDSVMNGDDGLVHVLVSRNLNTFAFSRHEQLVSVFAVDGWS